MLLLHNNTAEAKGLARTPIRGSHVVDAHEVATRPG